MNNIVDMQYLTAIEDKARAELENFVQNNMATLNVIRLAKLGLIASQGQPTAFSAQPEHPADEE